MKNGDLPITPLQHEGQPSINKVVEKGCAIGLTKREYFAAMAMQGILSNPSLCPNWPSIRIERETLAIEAAKQADALLKALEE